MASNIGHAKKNQLTCFFKGNGYLVKYKGQTIQAFSKGNGYHFFFFLFLNKKIMVDCKVYSINYKLVDYSK